MSKEKKTIYVVYCDYTDLHGVFCQSMEAVNDVIRGDMAEIKPDEIEENIIEYRIVMRRMTQRQINNIREYNP